MPVLVLSYELHSSTRVPEGLERELARRHFKKVFTDRSWAACYEDTSGVETAIARTRALFDECAVAAGVGSYSLKIYTTERGWSSLAVSQAHSWRATAPASATASASASASASAKDDALD